MLLSQAFIASLLTGVGALILLIVVLGLALIVLYLVLVLAAIGGAAILLGLFVAAALGGFDRAR